VTTSTTTSPVTGGRPAAARRRRPRPSLDRITFMAAFLGLPLVIFVLFVVWPVLQALYYSMTDWSGFSASMSFTGLDNYRKLLHDDIFLHAVRNNIELAIVVPLVTIVAALAIAIVVTVGGPSSGTIRGIRGAGAYRVVSFFPYAVPAIVIGLIWAQVYDPAAGLLNGVLTKVGLSGFENFAWLGEVKTAMPASMFVMIWASIGFYTVLFVAAIKGIPAEIYESARLDGAGRFRTSWSITLPLIRDNVQTAYIYIGILALDAFVYMQAMNSGGGPNNSTLTMSQYLLTTAFKKGQFGYATAMGVTLAVITLAFAVLVFLVNYLTGGREERRVRR
jgi:N-acetylglucosamine transport system permease protein